MDQQKKQSYENHVIYYIPHHVVFYGIVLVAIAACGRCIYTHPDQSGIWMTLTLVFVLLGFLSFMLRQHYALGNQNRIIRLEMRLRYFQLTGERFELLEPRLSFGQIAALRFASDEELPALLKRALDEQLRPGAIKKAIKNWLPDHMRV